MQQTGASLETIVQRMIDAGESEENIAAVIREKTKDTTSGPSPTARAEEARQVGMRSTKAPPAGQLTPTREDWGKLADVTLPAIASTGAAMATGGASLPIQALAQGGAGLLSGATRAAIRGGTVGEMGASGALDAASNTVPMGLGAGARQFAKPLMRSALRISAPIARKFGDIVPTALAERILPTASGAAKAEALREAGSAEKELLLRGSNATIDPNDLATAARARMQPHLEQAFDAGETTTTQAPKVINALGRKAPMDLQRLDRAKSKWDDKIKNAIAARKFSGTVPDINERTRQALAGEARDALEQAAPGYKAVNKRIMTLEGIRQAAANRIAIPATGLADNLLVFSGLSPSHVAARLAMSPVIKGGAAIGANELGKAMMSRGAAPTAEMIRAAILQLLQQGQ